MSNNVGAAPNDAENESMPLEIFIEQKLEQLSPLSDSCCIYRVPERLRCVNPNMYTPKVVSIGPLHHGKETLQEMEEHKYRYLNQFLDRTQQTLQFYIQEIRNQEAKLRSFYAERIKFSSDEFVTIILVDSAFIIELFFKRYFKIAPLADRITGASKMIRAIIPDLILLENQVPFFILEILFDLGPIYRIPGTDNPDDEGEKLSLIHLFRNFYKLTLMDIGVDNSLQTVSSSQVEGKHFLDIMRNLCLPPEPLVGGRRSVISAPSITELHRAGVKLRVPSTRNLFSIRFDNGILEIPKITISHRMERTLKNIVAFEQCHYDNTIGEYLYLVDCFVNNPKDVELLVKYGIVTNTLGDSTEASAMINSFCSGLIWKPDDFCFATLYEELHEHCQRPWNKWIASLRQNYLNSPWTIASVVAGSFLIILTLIQTVCALDSLS